MKIVENDFVYTHANLLRDALLTQKKSGIYTAAYQKIGIGVLPVGVNLDRYSSVAENEYEIDVSYVSHLYDPAQTLKPILFGKCHIPDLNKDESLLLFWITEYLESMTDFELLEFNGLMHGEIVEHMRDVLERKSRDCGVKFIPEILRFCEVRYQNGEITHFSQHGNLLRKMRPIASLIKHGIDVKVYGRNWEKYPGFEKISMGVATNGEELNNIMAKSKINLNLNPATTYHMRVPEILASRNFMLTRALPCDSMPILNLFEEEKEVVLFYDEADLIQKVKYYLEHEETRLKIVDAAYHKLKETCTYKEFTKNILQDIRGRSVSPES